MRLMPNRVPFRKPRSADRQVFACLCFHRILHTLREQGERPRNVVRDAVDAEISKIPYQVVNAFYLD